MKNRLFRTFTLLLALCLAAALAGCGGSASGTAAASGTETALAEDSPLKQLEGTWRCAAMNSDGYITLPGDQDIDDTLTFYEEDGKLLVDYYYCAYETTNDYQGYGVEYQDSALDETTQNTEWCAQLTSHRESTNEFFVSLEDENTLVLKTVYHYDYGTEDTSDDETVVEYDTFVPDDESFDTRAEELRYPTVVEVSTMEELFDALADNTRIVLNGGTYNFSDLGMVNGTRDEHYLYTNGYGEQVSCDYLWLYGLSNVCIEAKDGADVLICTSDPAVAPITLTECDRIVLRNLTVGHEVEKGYCAGSVIAFEASSDSTVSNCDLYGSGAYGISGYDSYNVTVDSCDIHDCTYGLVDLNSVSRWAFNNCTMRDSVEFSMFNLYYSYMVTFTGCTISDNTTSGGGNYFIQNTDCGGITFTDCAFTNNSYSNFVYDSDTAEFDNCPIEDDSPKG